MNRLRSSRLSLLALVVCSFATSAPAVAADTKIGYVEMQRVFDQAPFAVKTQKKITADFAKRELDLQKLGKQIKAQQDALEKNGATMSETDRRNRERDLSDASREFQRKQREFREDLDLRLSDANNLVLERAFKVLKQIAENEKYDLIIQDAVYFSPKVDITDKVIKALADDGKLPAQ